MDFFFRTLGRIVLVAGMTYYHFVPQPATAWHVFAAAVFIAMACDKDD